MTYLQDVLDHYGLIVAGLDHKATRFYRTMQDHFQSLTSAQRQQLADAWADQGTEVDLGPRFGMAIYDLMPKDAFQLTEADLKKAGLLGWDVTKTSRLVTLHLKEAAVKDYLEKN
jgi:hypothetical protein